MQHKAEELEAELQTQRVRCTAAEARRAEIQQLQDDAVTRVAESEAEIRAQQTARRAEETWRRCGGDTTRTG